MSATWLVLQAVAITIVFVRGSIFRWVRESGPALWREGASCPLCAGVWIGMILHGLNLYIHSTEPLGAIGLKVLLDSLGFGALVGTISLIVFFAIGVLDKHREK